MNSKEIRCSLLRLLGIMPVLGLGKMLLNPFNRQSDRFVYVIQFDSLCIVLKGIIFSHRQFLAFKCFVIQVSSNIVKLQRDLPEVFILRHNHVPSKTYWDLAIHRALQMIDRSNSELTKAFTTDFLSRSLSTGMYKFHIFFFYSPS